MTVIMEMDEVHRLIPHLSPCRYFLFYQVWGSKTVLLKAYGWAISIVDIISNLGIRMAKAKLAPPIKITRSKSNFRLTTTQFLLALSLLINVSLISFVWYIKASPKADFALLNEARTRSCGKNYALHMSEFNLPGAKALFSENACNRNYLTGATLPFHSSDGRFNIPATQ